ncbi:hypothetical protein [Brevibacterium aurantiacum]|uniref:hypothetical protein n=1 Tax=Brevibacterium aurantiacum TaxID=273384 RepID=UPI001866CB56|nr:hypothetical protein [Brevibacterium aurantiacum]
MPRTTIGLGVVLIAVGVIAYVATAFAIGIHIALVVAILGIFGTAMNGMQIGALMAGEAERPAAVITSIITFVLLIIYVVMGVRSFIAARRWKNSAQTESAQR